MNKKNLILIAGAFILSVVIGSFFQTINATMGDVYSPLLLEEPIFEQNIIAESDEPVEITKIYREGRLIGVVYDINQMEVMAQDVYQTMYAEEFPDSKLGFMDDIYQLKELSYNLYENKDEEIFNYIKEENLFAIETNKIEFSNGAIIYVKNIDDFNSARERFILNFIDKNTYELLRNDESLPLMTGYGTRNIGFEVEESIKVGKGLATYESIYTNEDEIMSFLSYGYDPTIEEYEVQEYDTVTSIAYFHKMSTSQLRSINPFIKDDNQFLVPGDKLNITYYNSPLTVKVVQERKTTKDIIPDDPIIIEDPGLDKGKVVIDIPEKIGKADVTYNDTYINGKAVDSKETNYVVVDEPVREQRRVGTYVKPYTGSGNYRKPIDNYYIPCHYYCYSNHRGTDFFSAGGGSGAPIYPIDTGVVTTAKYSGSWGYYVVVDHGNGLTSLYAHMMSSPTVSVGETVGKGSVIGYVGETGIAYGAHVHLEIRKGGSHVNPCSVIGC